MIKRIFLIIFILTTLVVLSGAWYVYINRQEIFDKSIDKLLQDNLPWYIDIIGIKVDLDDKTILIDGFTLRNPEGFNNQYLVEIPKISCNYSQIDGNNILKGIALSSIELSEAHIFIERDLHGVINLEKMDSVLHDMRPKEKPGIKAWLLGFVSYFLSPVKNISQLLQIEPLFNINNGKLFFEDYYIGKKVYVTSIESINGTISLDLKRDFKGIDYLRSHGRGLVNAKPGQVFTWVTEYDPTKEKLTMRNTLDIQNVDFTHFEPYYGRYSPFTFKKGTASGRMIFNFDNGEIGSDNELLFSGLDIEQKKDHSFNKFWPTGSEDLYKYFSSEEGDIVFDFKIKSSMDEPRFYLGSKTKRALAYMVFDKVTSTIFSKEEDAPATDGGQPDTGVPQEKKTKFERILDIFKGL
jgi:hypothetical protein